MIKTLKELWLSLDGKEKKYLKIGLILIFGVGFTSIFILPILFSLPAPYKWMNFTQTGAIGDTINGISSPFIALIVAVLTFLAFYIQYKANIQQRQQFKEELDRQNNEAKEQDKIWKTERFENRFFELIKLHKANVSEMNIGDSVLGSKCFVPMFYELRYCYIIVDDFVNAVHPEEKKEYEYANIDLMSLSYKIFFYGIGPSPEKQYLNSLTVGEHHLFLQIKTFIEKLQQKANEFFKKNPAEKYYVPGEPITGFSDENRVEFYYYPYDGHVNRLGHYYRHLFQTVNYVITQDFLNEDQKYSYIKTLRAQLSNFEQLLLYYNALAWFDDQWKEAFTTYRFIKNLPLPLADFYIRPEKHFEKEIKELEAKGISMFELLE